MKKYIITETQMKKIIDRLVYEEKQINESKNKKMVKKEGNKQQQTKPAAKKPTKK